MSIPSPRDRPHRLQRGAVAVETLLTSVPRMVELLDQTEPVVDTLNTAEPLLEKSEQLTDRAGATELRRRHRKNPPDSEEEPPGNDQ